MGSHLPFEAREAGADDVVGLAVEHGADERAQLLGGVLAVGVEEGDGGGPGGPGQGQALAHRGTEAPVAAERAHGGAGPGRGGGRPVGRPVVHDEHAHGVAAHLGRRPADDGRHGRFLVVGGEEHDDRPGHVRYSSL